MIFVDTSFFVALRLRRDVNHQLAAELLNRYADRRLLTSNHVRGETWTYLRRRAGHASAVNFLDALESSPRMRIERASAEVEAQALGWLRQRDEREYSSVDAVSFAIMRRMRAHEAFAFDGDFSAAGFVELR